MREVCWPTYDGPADLPDIEAVPLADRWLPLPTYALLARAAAVHWPNRLALSVLRDAAHWVSRSAGA